MNGSCKTVKNNYISPQCQHFVIRKKRLCRMTVKPGKSYCGEHEPLPKTDDGQDDTRIPCPNDPKHTCYASKLEKHLSICNARQQEQPDYIVHNINAPAETGECPRLPLAKLPPEKILQVIDKINVLYDKYLKDEITALPEQPIHSAVLPEFSEAGRTESSRRHLRQASSLMRLVEEEQLVADRTAYVELGAGKGQLSFLAWRAWGRGADSHVLLVDRASLRHKRDNKLRDERAHVTRLRADLAHLCLERVPAVRACDAVVGFAKHLCGAATDLALRCLSAPGATRVRGAVLATCCHHRCARAAYPAAPLQKLGIDAEEFNILLGIVSWATCGDGRSRDLRNQHKRANSPDTADADDIESLGISETHEVDDPNAGTTTSHIDDDLHRRNMEFNELNETDSVSRSNARDDGSTNEMNEDSAAAARPSGARRAAAGRRAKALLDWGRVLFLRERGFRARLVRYVPPAVSPENLCIVASRRAASGAGATGAPALASPGLAVHEPSLG